MNIVSLAVLTSSFAFSKYRRAQTTPIIDLHCIIRFNYRFLQSFTSPVFRKYRAHTALIQTYIAENLFIFLQPLLHINIIPVLIITIPEQ